MTPDDITRLADEIGRTGAVPTESDRISFEAWMHGHCWKVEGKWTGTTYHHDSEAGGYLHAGTMNTRRLFAAWRDRGALDSTLAQQGKAEGFVLVRKEAIDWLNGESDFECPPERYFRGEPPRYWWRSVFREKAGLTAA